MAGERDSLTGRYQRTWMINFIEKAIQEKGSIGIGIMDLDYFTNINARIGYENGDMVLKKIADSLPEGRNIKIARYGSDEFLFLLTGYEEEFIKNYFEQLRKRFRKSRFIDTPLYEKVRITFSLGVAFRNSGNCNTFSLLKTAEIALAKAKKEGRNRIEYLTEEDLCIHDTGNQCVTLAGKSLKGFCKEGAFAYTASISEPYGVELDQNKDILFVDRSNHQIKRIHKARIYTVAGCRKEGYAGDGGAPCHARMCKPSGVCVDKDGRIYIADTGNHCIRKIEQGKISTVAGNGKPGYAGDGTCASMAALNRPGGVAVDDDGNLYTNDYGNNVIRKIDSRGIISTIVGSGAYGYEGDGKQAVDAALNKIYGLCVEPTGETLYIADYENNCVRCVSLGTGIIQTLCGTGEKGYEGDGGCCRNARLNGPYWVHYKNGCLYIADAGNHCIRRVHLGTKIITTVAGGTGAGYVDHTADCRKIKFCIPAGIASDEKFLYIADYGNNAIRRIAL